VVADVRSQAPDAPAVEEVYRPNVQQGLAFMHFAIRTRGNPLAYAAPIRDAIRAADAQVPIAQVRALDELFTSATSTRRTVALLLASFAALGFALGAVGIYGVVSHLVGQRTRELGIRAALGAAQSRVTIMVVGEGVRMAGVGVAIGLVASLVAARSLGALVFGVSTADPLVFGGVALLLLASAAGASYLPARRAARADPLTALRSD
jgi:ABC-type antimicrobial peptide transport system permease subunit